MAEYVSKKTEIKNQAFKQANQVIELQQKDHFKHFQRLSTSLIRSNKEVALLRKLAFVQAAATTIILVILILGKII